MALCLQSFGNCQCWKDMTACPTGGETDEFAGFKPAYHRATSGVSVVASATTASLLVR